MSNTSSEAEHVNGPTTSSPGPSGSRKPVSGKDGDKEDEKEMDKEKEKEQARLLKHAKKCGFARIKGIGGLSHVDHVMRSYSIILGRPNKSFEVDISMGETMSVSRKHGEIYYDFDRKGFFLKVLGKNGIHVDGTLVTPSDDNGGVIELSTKTWLQVASGDEDRVVFLLPKRKRRLKRKNDEEDMREQGDDEDDHVTESPESKKGKTTDDT